MLSNGAKTVLHNKVNDRNCFGPIGWKGFYQCKFCRRIDKFMEHPRFKIERNKSLKQKLAPLRYANSA